MVRIYTDGRITIPYQLRKRFDVKEGDYVRLVLMEVFKENDDGEWISRKMGIG